MVSDMNKNDILIFARNSFKQFYTINSSFLEKRDYKPGKKTYRNLLSLNKMMYCYIYFEHDYIEKAKVIELMGWDGPSSYVQHERIITNFSLTDISWKGREREVLLLNDTGKALRNKYIEFCNENPEINLAEYEKLPDFAIEYLISELKNTTSQNMTLWKNTILTALYVYCVLGYIPQYSNSGSSVSTDEENAFIECLNYVRNDGTLQDITYTKQPIAMLKNLDILNSDNKLTKSGYKLLRNLELFKETDTAYVDFLDCFKEDVTIAADILSNKIALTKVEAPVRKERSSVLKTTSTKTKRTKRDYLKEAERDQKIGNLGEQLALEYERNRLKNLGVEDVESKVFLTSENSDYGNSFPCDIISINDSTGDTLYIEVKTTKEGIDTPFYISREEVLFSEEHRENYSLYRVFDVMNPKKTPRFYETTGYVGDNFTLNSNNYVALRDIVEVVDVK